jgi:hypothetical protein
VSHTYNPCYTGDRDHSVGPQFKASPGKIPNTKRAGGMAQGGGPEFKPQYHKKKKRIILHYVKLTSLRKKNF